MRTLLIALLFAACATRKAPTGPRPEVVISQISGVPLAARYISGGMSVRYRVAVRNTTKEPITLQRVSIESVGMGAYVVSHVAVFDPIAIAPAQSREVVFWAATQRSENVTGANGPVTLRVVASFDSASGRFEDVTVQNVSALGMAP
jgi:hypothetical protein